jgi:hypothetical protein
MNWSAIYRQVAIRGALLVAAILCYGLLRRNGFYDWTARDAEGLNTLILLVGNIYAVMFAFVVFVIWGQFTDVETFVRRECNSLNDLLRFSRYLDADSNRAIRRAAGEYQQSVLNSEWQCLGNREKDEATERCFRLLIAAVIRATPADANDGAMRERLIDVARLAGEHRDERITKSLTRIPPTLLHFVNTMALALLLLVYVYPFHDAGTGVACFTLIAVVLGLANIVMTDTDNPFNGVCNVSPRPFSDLTL